MGLATGQTLQKKELVNLEIQQLKLHKMKQEENKFKNETNIYDLWELQVVEWKFPKERRE